MILFSYNLLQPCNRPTKFQKAALIPWKVIEIQEEFQKKSFRGVSINPFFIFCLSYDLLQLRNRPTKFQKAALVP